MRPTRLVLVGVAAVLATPLLVTTAAIFPFELGSALAGRVLIELLALVAVITAITGAPSRPVSVIPLVLTLFAAVLVVAGMLGADPAVSFWSSYAREGGGWATIHWVALVLVLASVGPRDGAWRWIVWSYIGVGATLAALALLEAHALWPFASSARDPRVAATVGNAAQLGAVLAASLILLAGQAASLAPGWRLVMLPLGFATLLFWALLLTGSRGPALGLLTGLTVFAFASSGARRRRMAVGIVGIAVTTLVVGGTVDAQFGGVGALWRRTGLAERLELWRVAWAGFREHPFLGWGPGNYSQVFDRYVGSPAPVGGWSHVDSPHNAVLEVGVAAGLVGLLALAFIVLVVARDAVRHTRLAGSDSQAPAALGAFTCFTVHGMFAPHSGTTSLGLALLLGWLAAHATPATRSDFPATRSLPRGTGWAVAATLAIVVGLAAVRVHLPTYRAAAAARRALAAPVGTPAWHAAVERSIMTFPPRSAYLRRLAFGHVASALGSLSGARLGVTRDFIRDHGFESLDRYPGDGRLQHAVLAVLQADAEAPRDLHRLEPYLDRLARLAPARVGTHQLRAIQALRLGDCATAQQIMNGFTDAHPEATPEFAQIRRVIESMPPSQCDGATG